MDTDSGLHSPRLKVAEREAWDRPALLFGMVTTVGNSLDEGYEGGIVRKPENQSACLGRRRDNDVWSHSHFHNQSPSLMKSYSETVPPRSQGATRPANY